MLVTIGKSRKRLFGSFEFWNVLLVVTKETKVSIFLQVFERFKFIFTSMSEIEDMYVYRFCLICLSSVAKCKLCYIYTIIVKIKCLLMSRSLKEDDTLYPIIICLWLEHTKECLYWFYDFLKRLKMLIGPQKIKYSDIAGVQERG